MGNGHIIFRMLCRIQRGVGLGIMGGGGERLRTGCNYGGSVGDMGWRGGEGGWGEERVGD